MDKVSKYYCARFESAWLIGFLAIQRHMVLSDDSSKGVTLRRVIANPGSYVYFSPKRFKPIPDDCKKFNDWKYGFENDKFTYRTNLISTEDSRTQSRDRYLNRETRYLFGTADLGAEDQGCEAQTQGASHFERGQLFWQHIAEEFPGPYINTTQKAAFVEGVGHNASGMFTSKDGLDALFSL